MPQVPVGFDVDKREFVEIEEDEDGDRVCCPGDCMLTLFWCSLYSVAEYAVH